MKAIHAGLPVLVEKGMAPDWDSAQRLVKAALQHRAVVCVAQNYRYKPMERTIHHVLHDPNHPAHPLGVHLVMYTQNRVRPMPRTLTYPFASVWDMSCHHFDTLLFWFGPISRMTAHGWSAEWSAYEHDNNTSAHIVLDNGTHCHYIHTHDAARGSLEIQIHGERGALVTDGDGLTFSERPLEQFGSRPLHAVPLVAAEGEADLLRDFHRYICNGVEPGTSARNNLETMAACEMMVRSIGTGQAFRREQLEG
jgi:predicted dehydrogenase